MALPVLIKLGALGAAIFLALKAKPAGGVASNSGPAECRILPVPGARWKICRGGAGTTGTGPGPWVGTQLQLGAWYQSLYHATSRALVAIIDVRTYESSEDSALVVGVPKGETITYDTEARKLEIMKLGPLLRI